MDILLLRPVPGNERFGLGPFFRIEPLGMEYIAAALEAQRSPRRRSPISGSAARSNTWFGTPRPALVGIAAMHALETDEVLALARTRPARSRRTCRSSSAGIPRRRVRDRFSRRMSPPWCSTTASARCRWCARRSSGGRPLTQVPGLALPDGHGGEVRTAGETGTLDAR